MESLARRIFPALAGFTLLVALVFPAQAGINRWTPVGPGGGTVLELAFDPETPGTIYALLEGGGIFKSTNGGETWTWASNGLLGRTVHALALDPRHPDTLFVGMLDNEGGVYRSTNSGLTWVRVFDLIGSIDTLAVAPGEPSTVFAARGPLVYRSPDGGNTWQLVLQTGLSFMDIEVDPSDPRTVYAAGFGGIWKSGDGGVSWQPSDRVVGTEGLDRLTGVFDVAVAPSNPQRLYAVANLTQVARSDDGGATWRVILPFNFDGRVVKVDPVSAETVYTGGTGTVMVSRDAGESFEWLRNGYPRIDIENNTPDAWDVEIDPHAPDRIYAGVGYLGVLIYEDGQWHQPPLTGMTKNSVHLLGTRPDGTIYARFSEDVDVPTLFSRNGGRTWSPLAPENFGTLKVRAMAFDPRQPHVAWLTLGNQIFRTGPNGGGTTDWTPHSSLFDRYPINAFAVLGSQEVVAGICGIWRTLDRGRTWTETLRCNPGGPDDNQIRRVTRVAVDPFNPNVLLAGSQVFDLGDGSLPPRQIALHIHISQDRGASWRRVVNGTDLFAFDPSRRGAIYAARGDSVLRSTDYGRTWVRGAFTGSRITDLAVDPFSPGTLYAATRELGVFRSRNGGATWETVNAGLARIGRLEIGQILADPVTPHRFFVTPFEGGLFTARFSD